MNYNTIVIGAGPAGMAAALYLKRAGISVLLIDKDAPGGQMLKTSKIENYLGFNSINGADLALKMYNQIKENDIKVEFGRVIKIENNKVITDNNEYNAENIIIATGVKPNKLNLKNEDIRGISYCAVCDGTFYKDKIVGVVGGGNAAFTNAIYLAGLCKKVYIFVRSKIRADQELIKKAKTYKNIIILEKEEVKELITKNNELKGIKLNNQEMEIDALFVSIGGKPQIDFIRNIELENGRIKVDETMETSKKNIYACGDVINKDFYQIITAMSDGIVAALNIKRRCDK